MLRASITQIIDRIFNYVGRAIRFATFPLALCFVTFCKLVKNARPCGMDPKIVMLEYVRDWDALIRPCMDPQFSRFSCPEQAKKPVPRAAGWRYDEDGRKSGEPFCSKSVLEVLETENTRVDSPIIYPSNLIHNKR